MEWPTGYEPVNESAATDLWVEIAPPTARPSPITTLSTPFGSPASCSARASSSAIAGATPAGLSTTALPATSAGAIFHAGIAIGKFQGVISATPPSGCLVV